jgi:hypothetical protein
MVLTVDQQYMGMMGQTHCTRRQCTRESYHNPIKHPNKKFMMNGCKLRISVTGFFSSQLHESTTVATHEGLTRNPGETHIELFQQLTLWCSIVTIHCVKWLTSDFSRFESSTHTMHPRI